MASKISLHLLQEAVNAVHTHGTIDGAARELDVARTTLQSRLATAKRAGVKPDKTATDPSVISRREKIELQDRVRDLEAEIKAIHRRELTEDRIRDKIFGLASTPLTSPNWALSIGKSSKAHAVPIALWSDWHWGEVVKRAQVNGVNEYNLTIARQRLRRLVAKTIELLTVHRVDPNYPGIVVNLGGDMVSGDIHEELAETNELPSGPILLDITGNLIWALGTLADRFGRVFVAAVPGNHGRLHKKPRFKDRAFTNFDWIIYHLLAMHFAKDKRFTFHIPDGPDAAYTALGHRYLLTHGDNLGVSGGDGIIGALGPILRGEFKVRNSSALMGRPFDTIMMGHWHQYIPMLPRLMVNDCLKGYDEFAMMRLRAGPNRPQQALWFSDAKYGPIMPMGVFVTDEERATGKWAEAA